MSLIQESIDKLAAETPDQKLADVLAANLAEVAAIRAESDPAALSAQVVKIMDDVTARNTFEGVPAPHLPAMLTEIEDKKRDELTLFRADARSHLADMQELREKLLLEGDRLGRAKLAGTGKLKLKISKKLKKGKYQMDLVGTDSKGVKRFTAVRVTVR